MEKDARTAHWPFDQNEIILDSNTKTRYTAIGAVARIKKLELGFVNIRSFFCFSRFLDPR